MFILIAISSIGTYFFAKKELSKPLGSDLVLTIEKGYSIEKAVKTLHRKAGFKYFPIYKYASKIYAKNANGTIKAATYRLPASLTRMEAIKALFSDKYYYYIKLTFPEGIDNNRFVSIISDSMSIGKEILNELLEDRNFLKENGVDSKNALGYLLPGTYKFYPDATAEFILSSIINSGNEFWEKNKEKAIKLEMSRHEVLTLASIVEAESPLENEKPIVSGLYHNRLRIGMLLQTDPTVQFAIGEKRRVLYKDLEINHPYNTYKNSGLPPGPINNPGRESILAALTPSKHKYLYMVAVGDGSGRHNFAETHSQHINYVQEFRRNIGRQNN